MSVVKIKMPDLGEGMTECEIVEWNVKVGDVVKEDDVLAGVMTDKAVVEIPSPVDGVISELSGEVGELIPVGTVIVVLDVADEAVLAGAEVSVAAAPIAEEAPKPVNNTAAPVAATPAPVKTAPAPAPAPAATVQASAEEKREVFNPQGNDAAQSVNSGSAHPLAAPAVRQRAKAMGIALESVAGSGPDGRVLHQDLDQLLQAGMASSQSAGAGVASSAAQTATMPAAGSAASAPTNTAATANTPASNKPASAASAGNPAASNRTNSSAGECSVTPIIGLRRKIGERMQDAKQRIPHITYVEAVDVTELEALRNHLNSQKRDDQPKLSVLPLLTRAIALAVREFPVMNSHYDDVAGELRQYASMQLGIATQTDRGLLVPVLREAQSLDIWEVATGIQRLATLGRQGTLARDELSGSTVTISSLGKLGGLVSTPVINSPEVCIIGVNKIQMQPVYQDGGFVPRQIMNLSSSFDHRIVDGWEAAQFIQCLREHLEHPATLFIED